MKALIDVIFAMSLLLGYCLFIVGRMAYKAYKKEENIMKNELFVGMLFVTWVVGILMVGMSVMAFIVSFAVV